MKQHNQKISNYEISYTGKAYAIKCNQFPRFEGFVKLDAISTKRKALNEFYDFIGLIDQPTDTSEFNKSLKSAMEYFYKNSRAIAA